MTKLTTCFLVLGLALGIASSSHAGSSTYYWKYFSTGGSIYPWYTNDNSWGYHNTSGSGFMEMVVGDDWGNYSPWHPIPAVINTIPSGAYSDFWATDAVNSGGRIDTTWDNFLDKQIDNSSQGTEMMIWANYTNTQPIATSYNSSGQAVPAYTNVSLNGRTWNVYTYHWSSGYWTYTFVDQHQQAGENIAVMDFVNYMVSKGAFPNTWYLNEVGAGWEYANGWASCTSLSSGGY